MTTTPLIALGAPELLIILGIIILLFGAAKLPDLARSTGRSLRIFKAEINEKDTPELGSEKETNSKHDTEREHRGDNL